MTVASASRGSIISIRPSMRSVTTPLDRFEVPTRPPGANSIPSIGHSSPALTPRAGPIVGGSARNRFTGLVTRVVTDAVMAQVELQAGPHRVVSLLSREAVEELGLEPGVLAVASVKATNVVLEVPALPAG